MPQPEQQLTLTQQAQHRIERATPQHPGDRRGAHRAAETSFWNDWYRSGPNAQERNDLYAAAAIRCADLFHARAGHPDEHPPE